MRDVMRVNRRIYGPGPTRRSRVLLAVPGRDYPADFVLAITGGDQTAAAPSEPIDVVVEDHELSTIDRTATKVVVADEDNTGSEPDEDDDDPSPVVDLGRLDRDALVAIAAERGVDLPARATKVQIIGALQAADQVED